MQSQRRQLGDVKTPIRRICEKLRELTTSAIVLLLMVLITSATVGGGQDSSYVRVDSTDSYIDSLASQLDSIAETVRRFRRMPSVDHSVIAARLDSLVQAINDRQIVIFGGGATDSLITEMLSRIKELDDRDPGNKMLDSMQKTLLIIQKQTESNQSNDDNISDNTKWSLVLFFAIIVAGLVFWSVFRDYGKVTDVKSGEPAKPAGFRKFVRYVRFIGPLISVCGFGGTLFTVDLASILERNVYWCEPGDLQRVIDAESLKLYSQLDALNAKADSILNTRPGKVDESLHGKLDSIMRVDPNIPDTSMHRKVDSLFKHDFSCIDPTLRDMVSEVMNKIDEKCDGGSIGSTRIEQLPTVAHFPTNVYTIERDKPPYSTYLNLVDALRSKVLKDGGELVSLMLIGSTDMRPPRGTIGSQAVPNSELAQRRAESVKRRLLSESILKDTARIVTLNSSLTAFGSKPIWSGETFPPPQSVMSRNRCVQVIAVWKKKS